MGVTDFVEAEAVEAVEAVEAATALKVERTTRVIISVPSAKKASHDWTASNNTLQSTIKI
jgi:hypothetical protein